MYLPATGVNGNLNSAYQRQVQNFRGIVALVRTPDKLIEAAKLCYHLRCACQERDNAHDSSFLVACRHKNVWDKGQTSLWSGPLYHTFCSIKLATFPPRREWL